MARQFDPEKMHLSEVQELFRYLGLQFTIRFVRHVPWDVMAAKFAYLLAEREGLEGAEAEEWASNLIAYAADTEELWADAHGLSTEEEEPCPET